MLHAVQKHKTRLHNRYLGERDGTEHRVHEEDEITSTVLGPIDFLAPSEAHKFWQRLLSVVGKGDFLPTTIPDNVRIELWKRNEKGNIEPDAVVTMKWQNLPSYILLIELKWRAGLSHVSSNSENQLSCQWKHYLNDLERKTALHLFIAPEVSIGARAYDEDIWQDRMVLIPWLTIRSVFNELSCETSGLGRWAKVADAFLDRVNIRRFCGFRDLLSVPAPDIPANTLKQAFWMAKPFFEGIVCIQIPQLQDTDVIFFESTKG